MSSDICMLIMERAGSNQFLTHSLEQQDKQKQNTPLPRSDDTHDCKIIIDKMQFFYLKHKLKGALFIICSPHQRCSIIGL